MIVLESAPPAPAAAADPVAAAAQALVEAARASDADYTVEELREMVDFELHALGEAGGMMAWVRNKASGCDPEMPKRLEASAARGYRSNSSKHRDLQKADSCIARTQRKLERCEAHHKSMAELADEADAERNPRGAAEKRKNAEGCAARIKELASHLAELKAARAKIESAKITHWSE